MTSNNSRNLFPLQGQKKSFLLIMLGAALMFLLVYMYEADRMYEIRLNDFEELVTCEFPRLDPFNDEIRGYIEGGAPNIICSLNHTMRFRTNFRNQIIPVVVGVITETEPNTETCCYKTVTRKNGSRREDKIRYSKGCYPVSLTEATDVPAGHEFVHLKCHRNNSKTHEDMFAFVHLKPEVEKRAHAHLQRMMNILIIGMDAQSRMNFLRTMPLSNAFLLQNLSAIPLKGHTKVGENSFPNLIPLLSGLAAEELRKPQCPKGSPFDNCSFIWKDFASSGYRTSFGVDTVWMSMFIDRRQGFFLPPTDYYLHPLTLLMANRTGHVDGKNPKTKMCYGPRLAFQVLLDYVTKTATAFEGKPYFQFIWSDSLFHDFINYPKFGDEPLLKTLKYLKGSGYLDNTLLIVLSDHGLRSDPITFTRQGWIEEKMPLVYLAFPPKFRKKYAKEMNFLKENGENRLTTHFDMYATLLHVLELETGKTTRTRMKGNLTIRGINLFTPIPTNRSCKDAGIREDFCVCHDLPIPMAVDGAVAISASSFVVDYINNFLVERLLDSKCAQLTVRNVERVVGFETRNSSKLLLTFVTSPGDAVFETTLSYGRRNEETRCQGWKFSGEISRINLYHDQSHCIDDAIAKKFCDCHNYLWSGTASR